MGAAGYNGDADAAVEACWASPCSSTGFEYSAVSSSFGWMPPQERNRPLCLTAPFEPFKLRASTAAVPAEIAACIEPPCLDTDNKACIIESGGTVSVDGGGGM